MCHDGNSAPLSVRYLNNQLTTLWQNAVQCVNESKNSALDVTSQEYEKSKHTRALAQFHYFGPRAPSNVRSTGDFFFYAKFSQPDLKFVCNHEALLSLTIETANLNLDFGKSSITGAHADHQMNKDVHDVQVTFSVPFYRHDARTTDSKLTVRPFNHVVRLTVFDLEAAHLLTLKSGVSLNPDVERALKFYLMKYLNFLHSGGNDILYDLPHNEDVQIDYTLLAMHGKTEVRGKTELNGKTQIYGKTEVAGKTQVSGKTEWHVGPNVHSVAVPHINDYLSWLWQNGVRLGRPSDTLSTCLAEISSNWVPKRVIGEHFFIRFGAPEVKALCPHEIVMSFNVENIAWFDSSAFVSPRNVYHNWVVSFVMSTVEEREGSIVRVKARFDTAQFSKLHSKRAETDSTAIYHFGLLVKFLQGNYFDILIRYSHHNIYVSGDRAEYVSTIRPAYKPGVAPSDEQIAIWVNEIQRHNFYGYDEITSLSEESINFMFQLLWAKETRKSTDNLLAFWDIECFQAYFDAPIVRLLSNGKAIIWITAKSGEVEVVKESKRKDFWTWPLPPKPRASEAVERVSFAKHLSFAFQVDLSIADDINLVVGDAWRNKFYNSEVSNRFRQQRDWHVFKHLHFDFRNATYIPGLSTVTGFGKGRESLSFMATVVHSAKEYLSQLALGGYNVIYSLPVCTNRLRNPAQVATDVSFQVVTKSTITLQTCTINRTVYEAPVILVLAMTNSRPMPSALIPWHDLWVVWNRQLKVLGSVYLAHGSFADSQLLTLLERVNRKTTLLPKFAGVVNGEWTFDITTWEQDMYRKSQECAWERNAQTSGDSYVEYDWEYYDEWSHRHKGKYSSEKNAESTLSCQTSNKVVIPTAYRGDTLDIVFKGESKLTVSGRSDMRTWSKGSTATWASTVRVFSGLSGFNVEATHNLKPVLSPVEVEGECSIDVSSLHLKYLPQSIDLREMLSSISMSARGHWALYGPGLHRHATRNPIVTRGGGLIQQLCLSSEEEMSVSQSTSTVVANGAPIIHTPMSSAPKVAPVVVETGKRYSSSVADVLRSLNETSAATPVVVEADIPREITSTIMNGAPIVSTHTPITFVADKRYSNSVADVIKSIHQSDSSAEISVVETSQPVIMTTTNGYDGRYSSSVANVLKSISTSEATETQPSVADLSPYSSATSQPTTSPTSSTSPRYSSSIDAVLKSISAAGSAPSVVQAENITTMNGAPVVPNGASIVVSNGTPIVVVSDKRYSSSVADVLKSVSSHEHVANGGPSIPNGTPFFVTNGNSIVAASDKRYSSSVAEVLNSLSSAASTEYGGSLNGDAASEPGSWANVQTMSSPGLYFWQPAGANRR